MLFINGNEVPIRLFLDSSIYHEGIWSLCETPYEKLEKLKDRDTSCMVVRVEVIAPVK